MTPAYIRDAYARRGFKAAMAAAKASMDERLVDEVMLASLVATGIAFPRTVVVVRKRPGTPHLKTANEVMERCDPARLVELRAELARRETPRQTREVHRKVMVPVSTGRLTAKEVATRQAVLARVRADRLAAEAALANAQTA